MANLVDRRAFLQQILGSAAALAVMPQLDLIAAANQAINPDDVNGPVWDAVYDAVLKEAWEGFTEKVGPFRVSNGRATEPFTKRDGYVFKPKGLMIEISEGRFAKEAGRMLGALCHADGWNMFAPPMLPKAVEIARTAHDVLRYVKVWDAVGSEVIHRLDVYGAAS